MTALARRAAPAGLVLALTSALAFGTSGALAKGLLDAGWSPGAAVTWRVGVSGALLALPAYLSLRGRWHLLRAGWRTILAFGLVAVASCQLAYFQAVQHVSVGVALLLEYLGVVLVVGWLWLRHGKRPRTLSIVGGLVALLGLVGVLDLVGGTAVHPAGVAWGLLAAIGLATYFVVSADERSGLPPVALAAGGMVVAAVALGLAGLAGILEMRMTAEPASLAGHPLPWWVLVVALGLVSTALAYSLGIGATRRLGSKVASFVGLTEVLFAVLVAWLLLGQMPRPVQLLGGVLILAGVVAVKIDERPPPQGARLVQERGSRPADGPRTAATHEKEADVTPS